MNDDGRILFPDDTPGDIGANVVFSRRVNCVEVACALCRANEDEALMVVELDENGRVSAAGVQKIAKHLWIVHNLPVIATAEGRG